MMISRGFDDVNEHIKETAKKSDMDRRFNKVEMCLGGVESRLGKVETRLDKVDE